MLHHNVCSFIRLSYLYHSIHPHSFHLILYTVFLSYFLCMILSHTFLAFIRCLIILLLCPLIHVLQAADQCARIGQLAIKWQKRVDRASRMPFPEDLNALYKIVKDTEAKKRKGDKDREKDREKDKDREGEDHYVLECSAKLAIAPLEKICELMQLLSSYAMELPSCGFRYGLAIAGNSNYMKVKALKLFIRHLLILFGRNCYTCWVD